MIIEVHKFLSKILKNDQFFNGKTFFVGGSVRDHFRNEKAHDVDIVINQKDGAKKLSYFIYNKIKEKIASYDKIITSPYNLGNYPIYSITFKDNFEFDGIFYKLKNVVIEIADTMKETFPDDESRQRSVEFSSLKDDIFRRDFSINSGLIDVISFEFLNLTESDILEDIKNGIIKCNKDDAEYISKILTEDPLRILRGCVFAARFNFKIDEAVKIQMIKNIDRLKIVSRERINAEIKKALDVQGGLYRLVDNLNKINGLDIVFPKIADLKLIQQFNKDENGHYYPDVRNIHLEGVFVFTHVMNVIKYVKKGYEIGLAALYHDVGKIYPEFKNGKVRFINHEYIGGKIIDRIFPEMKIDVETTKNVKFLVENHMKLHKMHDLSKKSIRKFIREIPTDNLRYELYDLCNADCLGTLYKTEYGISAMTPHYEAIELIENVIKEESIIVEKPFRYFNGNEIMSFLKISGKPVGDAIKIMLEIQDEYGFDKDKEFIKNEIIKEFNKKYGKNRSNINHTN